MGAHLVKELLAMGHTVVALDDLSGVGSQVIDVVEPVLVEKAPHQVGVGNTALDEGSPFWNLIAEATTQVIKHDNVVVQGQTMAGDMGTDESCAASDQRFHSFISSEAICLWNPIVSWWSSPVFI